MKWLGRLPWLLALILLCSCGGNRSTPPSGTFSSPGTVPPPGRSISSGNWEFKLTSSAGMPPLTISGNINAATSSLNGVVHLSGSTCFDPTTTIALTGTLSSAGDVRLSSATVAGQVISLNGTVNGNGLNGTYSVGGGCAGGDQGSFTGNAIPYIANSLNGMFTSSTGQTFEVTGDIAQNASPNSDGSYGIEGTATFSGSCLSSGTLISGSAQSGSFILGTSVAFQIQTGNGTVVFLGTLNQATGAIDGSYMLSGGTCDQSGTAALIVSSPWDY